MPPISTCWIAIVNMNYGGLQVYNWMQEKLSPLPSPSQVSDPPTRLAREYIFKNSISQSYQKQQVYSLSNSNLIIWDLTKKWPICNNISVFQNIRRYITFRYHRNWFSFLQTTCLIFKNLLFFSYMFINKFINSLSLSLSLSLSS